MEEEYVRFRSVKDLKRGDFLCPSNASGGAREVYIVDGFVNTIHGLAAQAVKVVNVRSPSSWLVLRTSEGKPEPTMVRPEDTEGWQNISTCIPNIENPVLVRKHKDGEVSIASRNHRHKDEWDILYRGDAKLSEYPEWCAIPK